MFSIGKLALRNVFRNKGRSSLTCGAIGFGVLMTMLLASFVYGLTGIIVDDVITGRVGALQVHKRGYDNVKDNFPLDYDMEYGGELQKKIAGMPGVTAVTGRILFGGSLNNGTRNTFIIGNAHDPAHEYAVCPNGKRGLEGQPLTAGQDAKGVLGFELADALNAKTGGTMVVQAAAKDGQQNAMDFEMTGTINNNMPLESKRMVYVPLALAQALLKLDGRVTEYAVSVADRERVDELAEALQAKLGHDYHVQTWKEIRPQVLDIVKTQRVILLSVCVVFLIIAVIGVMNTMLMAVLERTREIGTMMAVGVRRSKITLLFLMEAAAMAILGTGAGALGGFGIIGLIIHRGGLGISPPGSKALVQLQPWVPGWLVAVVVGATALAAVLAAVYPAARAAKLRPVEALRAL